MGTKFKVKEVVEIREKKTLSLLTDEKNISDEGYRIMVIRVCDLMSGYNRESAFNGKLNLSASFSREFRYTSKQQESIIDCCLRFSLMPKTIFINKNPYNVGYIIDGKQRLMSILDFVCGYSTYKGKRFNELDKADRERLLNTKILSQILNVTEEKAVEIFISLNK